MDAHAFGVSREKQVPGHRKQVDQLTEAPGGLDLCTEAISSASELGGPTYDASLQSHNNIEKEEQGAGVTPSRLDCFKQLRDELTCAVCLDICVRPCTTPCGHNYCRSCLRRNLELNRPCPKCRASLPSGFALAINTTLWNTIQHLFPAEAKAKPLTPQQPSAPPASAASRHPSGTVNDNPAAPFRPPRFIAPSGGSSDRGIPGRSAAVAGRPAAADIGLASLSGRSVSGPRPQRLLPGSFYTSSETAQPSSVHSAATAQLTAAAAVVPVTVLVPSLAELGVRSSRGGAAIGGSQPGRRHARSAERWEQHSLLPVPASRAEAAAEGATAAVGGRAARGPQPEPRSRIRPTAEQGEEPSLLMGLLAGGGPVGGPAGRPGCPAASRCPQAAPSCSTATAAAASAAPPPPLPPPSSTVAAGDVSLSLNPFMRKLRPLQIKPSTAAAVPSSAMETAPAAAATTSTSSCSTASDATVVGGCAVRGAGGGFTASQRALLGAQLRVAGLGWSRRESSAPVLASGSAVLADAQSDHSSACGESDTASNSGRSSSSIEGAALLEEVSPVGRGNPACGETVPVAAASPNSPPCLPRLRLPTRVSLLSAAAQQQQRQQPNAAGPSSCSESSMTTGNHSQGATAAAQSGAVGDVRSGSGGGDPVRQPHQQTHLDPDLPDNYDGEDPSAADTFFSSPFFDRTMLWDSLRSDDSDEGGRGRGRSRDGEDSSDAGSEVGFSPRWVAGGLGQARGLEELNAAVEELDRLELSGGRKLGQQRQQQPAKVGSAGMQAVQPPQQPPQQQQVEQQQQLASLELKVDSLHRGLRLPRAAVARGAVGGSVAGGGCGPGRGQLLPRPARAQAGDRECPIEILSDSDEEY